MMENARIIFINNKNSQLLTINFKQRTKVHKIQTKRNNSMEE